MQGSGFGTATKGLSLSADGVDICHTVEIYDFGKFYCYTNAGSIDSTDLSITLDGSGSSTSFIASDVAYLQRSSIVVTDI